MTDHIKAAVIGFYRQGATIEEIIGATGLHALEILDITKNIQL